MKAIKKSLMFLTAIAAACSITAACGKNEDPNSGENQGQLPQEDLGQVKAKNVVSLNNYSSDVLKQLGIVVDSRLDSIVSSGKASINEAGTVDEANAQLEAALGSIRDLFPQASALVDLANIADDAENEAGSYDNTLIREIEAEAKEEIIKTTSKEQLKEILADAKTRIEALISKVSQNKDAFSDLEITSELFKNSSLTWASATVKDAELPTTYDKVDMATFSVTSYEINWRMNVTSPYVKLEGSSIKVTRPTEGDGPQAVVVIGRINKKGTPDVYHDFELKLNVLPANLTAEEVADQAIQGILIPANLNGIVTDLNLPGKAYCDTDELNITWSSPSANIKFEPYDKNDARIEVTRAVITRPEVGEADIKTTLVAQVTGNVKQNHENGKSESVVINKTVTYEVTILAKQPKKTYDFVEDFNGYDAGSSFADVRSPLWEYIDEQKRIREAQIVDSITNKSGVVFNNKIGTNNALRVASSAYSSASFDAYVSLPDNFVLETYMLSVDGGNVASLDFRSSGSTVFTVGNNCGEVTLSGTSTGYKLKEGVWNKIRLEYANGAITLKVYDFDTNTATTIATKNISAKEIDVFRITVPALEDAGLTYFSNIEIKSDINQQSGANPNRTEGIGDVNDLDNSVEADFDEYIVVDKGSEYQLPSLVVYNRFLGNKYEEGTNYSVTTTIESNGQAVSQIDTANEGDYLITYVITMLNDVTPIETKTLTRTVSVQEVGKATTINDFSISTVRNGNITLRGNLTRENNKIHYVLLNEANTAITASDIMNDANKLTINANDIKLNVGIPAQVGKYIYLVVEADNGTISDVYKYLEQGEEAPLTDVIKIRNSDQFYELCTNTDTAKDKFELAADIDMTGVKWGQSRVSFQGTLDGKGFTVRNIDNKADDVAGGLFYDVTNGTIKNIKFENCVIVASAECGLFGKQSNGGTFTNIEMKNVTVWGNNELNSTGYVGALVGRAREDKLTTITNVSLVNDKDHYIKSSRYTGGLLGGVEKATVVIKDCYIYSDLYDERQCTGGIIGRAKSGGDVTITNCIIRTNISSYKYAGFIIGENEVDESSNRGSKISNIVIAGLITGAETNKKNFGLISGRLQGKYVSISNILSLGARLGANSIGDAIDNSQDIKVMALDKGTFQGEGLEVALTNPVGTVYMTKQNTAVALNNEENCKKLVNFLDWENVWNFNGGDIKCTKF